MAEQINVSISQESVKQIIDAQVQAAVVGALSSKGDQLIESLVKTVLMRKRDSYSNTKTILEETIEAVIVEEVKAGMKRWVESSRPKIATAIDFHIKKNTAALVASIVDSTAKQLANSWYVNVEVATERKRS